MAEFQLQNDELEFLDDYYYFGSGDFDEDAFGFSETLSSTPKGSTSTNGTVDDPFGPDFEDDLDNIGKSRTDTTAGEARKGKDMQGIPWERLNFSRDNYRETRLKQYKNYESIPSSSSSRDELSKVCKQVKKGHNFYDFQFNTRLVKSTIVHFQITEGLTISTVAIICYILDNFNKIRNVM